VNVAPFVLLAAAGKEQDVAASLGVLAVAAAGKQNDEL